MPPSADSLGDQAVEFAAKAGLMLDPWQQMVLRGSLGIVPGGKWAARNVGLLVPRQNGKNAVLEARELFGLFVLGEKLIIHSAHIFDTATEHFHRLLSLIEGNDDLARHVRATPMAAGKESIVLRNGARLKIKARTKSGAGRGFSADLVVLDEAMFLPDEALSAMLPTLITRPNPQVWYTSSAGTAESTALWRLVKQGRESSPRLAYFEWGCERGADPRDRDNWVKANPGLGYRLPASELEDQLNGPLSDDNFAREHLGIWDDQANGAIPASVWEELADPASQISGQVAFSVEVNPERTLGSISAAGLRSDGLIHLEVIDRREKTDWIADRLAELDRKWSPVANAVDEGGPAGSLIDDIERTGVVVTRMSMRQASQAAAQMFDGIVHSRHFRHRPDAALDRAVEMAAKRALGQAWAWVRGPDADPLVSTSNAAWALSQHLDAGGLSPDDVYVGRF